MPSRRYGTLGVYEGELERHIAYDIGAAAVTRFIAAELGAPAALTRFSRLLIDCNRGADDPTLIMRLADGTPIEETGTLTQAERDKRIALYYAPYHAAIAAMIDRALAQGIAPVLLSMHSYTPVWKGIPRAVAWGCAVGRGSEAGQAPAITIERRARICDRRQRALPRRACSEIACGAMARSVGSLMLSSRSDRI